MINIQQLTLNFKHDQVFSNLNAQFELGQCYGIIGHNGSGKSVLFKALCGFLPFQAGQITVGQQEIKAGQFIQDAGVVIENPNFIGNLSGFENLALLAAIQNKISEADILATLERVGLADAGQRKYKHYSLGMKQRLRIAQAIMEKPTYYILDEIFNGLDEDGVQEMYEVIAELKTPKHLLLMTSHDRQDIETLCDHVFQIKKGELHEVV